MKKSRRILGFFLPSFVRNRVIDGVRHLSEEKGEVSILFCDICDFDEICSEYAPDELTSLLDEIFNEFDMLCDAVGVTKIETVGKTYMACAGIPECEQELDENLRTVSHARRTIELGIAMIHIC